MRDIDNNPVGSINSLSHQLRDALKFQNDLREAYVDLDFRDIPLSLLLGKQQVVWGETDNFRMLDRANPLDLTWHQVYESWDDLRRPLWMIKALWQFGSIGPLSDAFIETYWNPGDWYPAKQGFMPDYPWGIPSADPLAPILGVARQVPGVRHDGIQPGELHSGTRRQQSGRCAVQRRHAAGRPVSR